MTASDTHPRNRVKVLDSEMSYVDVGEGDPIVFLHGNPTSSYLWRNVIPHVSDIGRCLAPDMIGMGQSGKSPYYTYRFVDHIRHLDAWFDALNLTKVILVIHDWGSALGFNRAFRHQDQVAAIAYMEAVVRPFTWEDSSIGRRIPGTPVKRRRTYGSGSERFCRKDAACGVIRTLGEEEMATYRAPYAEREARLPTLIWPRQASVAGEPEDVTAIVRSYSEWLNQDQIPKLFIAADPGAVITAGSANRKFCETLKNQQEVTVRGRHFVQEDSPDEIGMALRRFVIETRSDVKSLS